VDQTQTLRYASRFESLLYVPAFTQKDSTIHYRIFYTGTSTEELQLNTGSTQFLSLHNHLYIRGKTQA